MARVTLKGQRVNFKGMLGTSAEKRSDLRAAGVEIAVKLQNRTQGGLDEGNRRFTPYSAGYAKQKGVSPNRVDLYRTGQMLNSLDVLDVTASSVVVGFTSPEMAERAEMNQQRGRRFLGIPMTWLEDLKRKYLLRRMAQGR
jgi:hypothetical protein